MKTGTRIKNLSPIVIALFITALPACSKQSWYHGVQSAQTAQCLQEPESEYRDCKQQNEQSYDEYDKDREELIKENTVSE